MKIVSFHKLQLINPTWHDLLFSWHPTIVDFHYYGQQMTLLKMSAITRIDYICFLAKKMCLHINLNYAQILHTRVSKMKSLKTIQFHLFRLLPVPTEPKAQLDLFYEPE